MLYAVSHDVEVGMISFQNSQRCVPPYSLRRGAPVANDVLVLCVSFGRRVLVQEWVEGEKGPWMEDGEKLLTIGLQCSVLQVLDSGEKSVLSFKFCATFHHAHIVGC